MKRKLKLSEMETFSEAMSKDNLQLFQNATTSVGIMEEGKLLPALAQFKGDEILLLWVARSHRGRGIARLLIGDRARYVTSLPSAEGFWKHLGFQKVSGKHGPIKMVYFHKQP